MENIERKMMAALCSVFWYEGLLEEASDDSYKGFLPALIEDLKNNKNTIYSGIYSRQDLEIFLIANNDRFEECFDVDERHTVIWQILVKMFGGYGTSPRTGWIEKREECAEFLEEIIKIWDSGAY